MNTAANAGFMVIKGPPQIGGDIDSATPERLRKHARALEEYSWQMFEALNRQASIAFALEEAMHALLDHHETGDVVALVAKLEELGARRERWREQTRSVQPVAHH